MSRWPGGTVPKKYRIPPKAECGSVVIETR